MCEGEEGRGEGKGTREQVGKHISECRSLQNHPIWSTSFMLCFKVLDLGNFPR